MLDGQLSIQFEHDSIYTQRYRIDPELLRETRGDTDANAAARELMMKARFINQRLSALSRLITTLCDQQKIPDDRRHAAVEATGAGRTGAATGRASLHGFAPDSRQGHRNAVGQDAAAVSCARAKPTWWRG